MDVEVLRGSTVSAVHCMLLLHIQEAEPQVLFFQHCLLCLFLPLFYFLNVTAYPEQKVTKVSMYCFSTFTVPTVSDV